ncbi:phosphatase PAP2 family protein [Lentilactobacillus kosonis]|uniref:Membrane-associated phospholipid phosphatase n=1 Tax=Lentilactobacillus kosonis TaxID=2810561 RepID=A0A401FLS4_9LACO|nr:phosphatase PAP2 family protein [Lentilactobacillus kosonis]GAY73293.1 membrane-associated phospholipid phosphatase [Lentilactobacillus kosonis]
MYDEDYMFIEPDHNRWAKLIVSFLLTAFIAVSVSMNFDYLQFLDSMITTGIQGKAVSQPLEGFYTMISFLASPKMDIFWILIIAFFLWGFKYKIPALFAIFTLGGADVIGFIIKNVVKRDRPPLHMATDDGYSFPSGHVLGAFIVLAIIWIFVVPLIGKASVRILIRAILIIGLMLVMFSRVYLNAHYPTDTIGAGFVAYTWLQLAEILYSLYAPNLKQINFISNSKI